MHPAGNYKTSLTGGIVQIDGYGWLGFVLI